MARDYYPRAGGQQTYSAIAETCAFHQPLRQTEGHRLQRAQPDDGPRHAGLRSDPVTRRPQSAPSIPALLGGGAPACLGRRLPHAAPGEVASNVCRGWTFKAGMAKAW